jgi:hypothetical protein
MIRAQFYLPEETYIKLNRLATMRKEPMAQIFREYVEDGLERDRHTLKGNAHVLLELAEMAEKEGWRSTGRRDGSVNHNTYVGKAITEALDRIHTLYGNTH